jgi:hypothetical protein
MSRIFLICLLPVFAFSQKHDYVWMHGNFNTFFIDFKDGYPRIDTVPANYSFLRTMTIMSNADGVPMFYSNGCSVKNTDHQFLVNGDSLLLDDYSCNKNNYMSFTHGGGVTLPDFTPDHYITICKSISSTLPAQPCHNNRLFTYRIDMTAENGRGAVLDKTMLVSDGCFQEASANRHANGRDWWIIVPDNGQDRFFRWLFTPSGLHGPWEQTLENPLIDGLWYCGWSEFSPDGSRFLINSCRKGVVVYDFDRCTGLMSNPIYLERPSLLNSNLAATFSPDSRYVYTVDSISTQLLQYDLTAADVAQTRTLLAIWDGTYDDIVIPTIFGFMQHGPDGRMYVWAGGSSYMHLIDFPNRRGAACRVRQRALALPGTCSGPSLYYPHFRLGPLDGSACDTLGLDNHPLCNWRWEREDTLSPLQATFTDLSAYEPATWSWDFGDGSAVSQDTSPVHVFPAPGVYTVCLTVCNDYACDTLCREVTVGFSSTASPEQAAAGIVLYPNPASSSFTLQKAEGVFPQGARVALYNSTGQLMQERRAAGGETSMVFSWEQYPAGVYWLRVDMPDAGTLVRKAIKKG